MCAQIVKSRRILLLGTALLTIVCIDRQMGLSGMVA